jgi:hypothetical protein
VVSMLASGTQDRGFEPGRNCQIFRVKNTQHAFLRRGSKAVCLSHVADLRRVKEPCDLHGSWNLQAKLIGHFSPNSVLH